MDVSFRTLLYTFMRHEDVNISTSIGYREQQMKDTRIR